MGWGAQNLAASDRLGWGAQNLAMSDRDPKKRPICQEEEGKGEYTQRWDCHRSVPCVSKSMDIAVDS